MLFRRYFYSVVFVLAFLSAGTLSGTHLVGGFISYEYVGTGSTGTRYNVKITSYRDCKPGSIEFASEIDVCVYNRSDLRLYNTYTFPRISREKVNPVGRTDCPEATQVCLEKAVFAAQITLPASSFGYYVKWEICCRNEQVNLRNDADGTPFIGQTYQTIIPPTNVRNSSPFFSDVPVPFICINDTTELNNYAIDPDGDSLVYKLATPWYGASLANNYPGCTPLYSPPVAISPADYQPGYGGNFPFGTNGISKINSANGVTTFMGRRVGNYAVAIDLLEYRNGVLLSSTRLDLQILIINCSPNNKPTVSTSSRSYTIMSGERLCFDVTASDKDNHNISLSGQGDLLTGANGFKGNRATFAGAFGKGTVSSQFCWETSCSQARETPYLFTAKAIDDGCPSKFTLVNIEIKVLPFTGKVTLSGNLKPCAGAKGIRYNMQTSADTPDELNGLTHEVTITGGVLVSKTFNELVIDWDSGETEGIIEVTPVSRFGCEGTPYVLEVELQPAPPKPLLQLTDTVCENESAGYSIVSVPGNTYSWFISNGTIAGAGNQNTVQVVWGTTGSASLRVVQYSDNGCPSDTALMPVWISKPGIPDIIGKRSICPNASGLKYSVLTSVGTSTYNWSVNGGTLISGDGTPQITVDWGNAGPGFVRVYEVDRFTCPGDPATFPVNKSYNMDPEPIAGDTDICEFSIVQYSVPDAPATVYNWSVTGGNILSGQGSNTVVVEWNAAGTGSLSVYETSSDPVNNLNCISALSIRTILIRPIPTADFISGVMEICQYSPDGLYSVSGFPGSVYLWSINGDTAGITGQGSSQIRFSYANEGTFRLQVTETSQFGCAGEQIDTLVIVHPKPRTGPVIGNSIICYPNTGDYLYSVNGFSGSVYTWFVDGGTPVSPSNISSIRINWSGQQNNRIRVLEVSSFGCPGDTQTLDVFYDNPSIYLNYITVNPPPRMDDGMDIFWKLNNAPRYNNSIFIEKRVAGSGSPFTLAGTVNGTEVTFNDFNAMNDSNAWEYRLRGYDLCGQELFTSIHTNILLKGNKTGGYEVSMNFTPYLGWGSTGIQYDLFRQLKNAGEYELYQAGITDFTASFANGLDHYTQCYRIRGTKNGSDTVTWSNEICFNFEPVIYIPDAFSPNGDEYNDVFGVKGGALKTVEMYIFNRWGEKLFTGNGINDTWDGKYKGKDQPQDVYMYYCYYTGYDGRKYSTKGTITLLR